MTYSTSTFIIILFFSSVACDFRIFGGSLEKIENFPYQASVLFHGSHICGGSIISKRHVLTAAHCFYGLSKKLLLWNVRVGSTFVNNDGTIYNVSEIITHPDFKPQQKRIDFDIAFLMLSERLKYDSNVHPIKLVGRNKKISAGSMCLVSGWGFTEESGNTVSEQLRAVEVPIVHARKCQKSYLEIGINVTNTMLCVGYKEGGKDACKGDSGGPLVCDGKQAGIVSFSNGCANPKFPGIDTKISTFRSYIKNITGV